LRDDAALDKIFMSHNISAVINFAAHSLVGESVKHPRMYYENNIGGAMCLLAAMRRHNVRDIVFSSTAAVYGTPAVVPISEDTPAAPINPYGQSKLAVEKILADYSAAYGMRYAALRYFNVAGAHPSGEIGECHTPETHLIPIILEVAAGKRARLPLFGCDYETPDGTCIRDYIHVMDVCTAHLLAVDALQHGNFTTNIGLGRGFSNMEVIQAARRITAHDIPVETQPRRPGDPPVLVAANEKIVREWGFSPAYTNIDEIIATAWQWHKKHPNGY
jgi:UDP-glucose 4-epimerase